MNEQYSIEATPTENWYVLKRKAPPTLHPEVIANGKLSELRGLKICLETGTIHVATRPAAPTPRMSLVEVGRQLTEVMEKVFHANGSDSETKLFIASYVTGYCGVACELHVPDNRPQPRE